MNSSYYWPLCSSVPSHPNHPNNPRITPVITLDNPDNPENPDNPQVPADVFLRLVKQNDPVSMNYGDRITLITLITLVACDESD